MTTILFDDEVDMIHDRFPIDMVEPLTEKEYFVRGCTALFDAVGIGIEKLDRVQRHLPEKYRAGKVIFVIRWTGKFQHPLYTESDSKNDRSEKRMRMGILVSWGEYRCRKRSRKDRNFAQPIRHI